MNEKERTSHMNKKLGHDAIYDARELGVPRMLLLGLQHLFAMFGATVLVPILVTGYGLPLSIQTTLLFAGIGTLLFHVCTKFKVPAFLGSSFAFLGGFQAVANLDSGKFAAMTGEEKLPYALGGVVVAGLLYLVLALLFKLVGAKKVMRYFPPIVTGPIIILIGLNLSGTAVTNASTCWWLALVAIAIIIVANIWGKGMIKIIPILLGVVGAYIVALIAGKAVGPVYTALAAADLKIAVKGCTVSALEPSAAVSVLYKDEIDASDNIVAATKAKAAAYVAEVCSADAAVAAGAADMTCEAANARASVVAAFELLSTKRAARLPKKHGNMAL